MRLLIAKNQTTSPKIYGSATCNPNCGRPVLRVLVEREVMTPGRLGIVPYGEMVESRIKGNKVNNKRRRVKKERKKICDEYVHQSSPLNFKKKSSGPALVGGSLFTLEKSQGLNS
jgi:hypothetical protein